MTNSNDYARARKRAEAKYRFFLHAAVYAGVMVLLVIINLLTSPDNIWFIWPLIGWGFAVALHGVSVYLLADRSEVVDALTEQELRQTATDKTERSQH